MKYLDFFEDVYYINLDYRIDRRENFEKRLFEVGINAIRFPAIQVEYKDCPQRIKDEIEKAKPRITVSQYNTWIKQKCGEIGCCLSHIEVIKQAKLRELKNVLIFEDDCVFLENWNIDIANCVDELKTLDWSIIYLGGEPNADFVPLTKYLSLVTGVYCAHSYAIDNKFFDMIIGLDINWCSQIDVFYLNYSINARKYIVPNNMMTMQDVSYSDIRCDVSQNNKENSLNKWNINKKW